MNARGWPVDPVHRASHLTAEGFWWSNMQNLIRLSARDQEIMALGRQQGIGEGFTIPVQFPAKPAEPARSWEKVIALTTR
jgi:LuxR family quorum-sensing system transcriptional regulator CciR